MPRCRYLPFALALVALGSSCTIDFDAPFEEPPLYADGSTGATDGGVGGTADSGGSGATGGSGGLGGTGGLGGSGGVGGVAGSGASGGSGGGGECSQGCDDGVDCTIDACLQDTCVHDPGPCSSGQYCDPDSGCVDGPGCQDDAPCLDAWGGEPCKTNVQCDTDLGVCTFEPLDMDGDGRSPVICGGGDCDDADEARHAGRAEDCDGKDNDCNTEIDDGATCGGLFECVGGACTCPAQHACGSECVDKQSDPNHCGSCFDPCPPGADCVNGGCECPGSQQVCDQACVDTQDDPNHCGQCGNECPTGADCQSGGCVCPPYLPDECAGTCVDTQTDRQHCGSCGHDCGSADCEGGQCVGCNSGLLVLMDVSGSMDQDAGGQSRLQAQLAAVESFVQESASDGLEVGAMYFPRFSGGQELCQESDYTDPDVAIELLPGNGNDLVNSMSGKSAFGQSVISYPLQGAIEAMRVWKQNHPYDTGAVIMINDGGIGIGCSSDTVQHAVDVATEGFSGTPSVRSFVISLGDGATPDDDQWWSEVPSAGGGNLYQTGDSGQSAILAALRSVRDQLECN